MLIRKTITRRRMLRGMLAGSAITVGLPLLECFLDDHGTALASGAPLPVRFGTWFWGLGMTEKLWVPEKVGADYDLKPELAALAPVKKHVNIFSRHRTDLGGRPDLVHRSGSVLLRCGQAPATFADLPGQSLDVTIGQTIGGGTPFPSLEMTATGRKGDSLSFFGTSAVNPAEVSPIDIYRRIFGADFQDPNSPHFRPNPKIMLRKSVLSAVREDSASLVRTLGAADRRRLEQHFTGLRGVEERLALQLQKPPPAQSCHVSELPPREIPTGEDVELLNVRHDLMTDLLVTALACNQTRVFNMVYSSGGTTKQGLPSTHHIITHEESTNEQGYQEMHSWFIKQAMGAWSRFVGALASIPEGNGSLLDNTLVYAHSEHDFARTHTLHGIPMMTAGRAGGRLRSGIHVDGRHQALASELGLTLLTAMGLEVEAWGEGVMRSTKTIGEILV
jgi:Protein of unknown function (DUF1552)